MELVLPTYNVHPYFSLKNLGKNCASHTAKYGVFLSLTLCMLPPDNRPLTYFS